MTRVTHRIRQFSAPSGCRRTVWGAQEPQLDHEFRRSAGKSRSGHRARALVSSSAPCAGRTASGSLTERFARRDDRRRAGVVEGKLDVTSRWSCGKRARALQSNMNAGTRCLERAIENAGRGDRLQKPGAPERHCHMGNRRTSTFPKRHAHRAPVHLRHEGADRPALNAGRGSGSPRIPRNHRRPHPHAGRDAAASGRVLGHTPCRCATASRAPLALPTRHSTRLAQGGTAVGTGLNTDKGWVPVAAKIAEITGGALRHRAPTSSRRLAPMTRWSSCRARSRPRPWPATFKIAK